MKRNNINIPTWITALLFIFSFSLAGLGISIAVGNFIPFWILFGFSFIFAIEKWFYYRLKQYKGLGTPYRVLLNLSMITTIGITIWTGIKLFAMEFVQNPLIGSLIFIGELVFLIWLWRIVRKNSWRWPSMKLTAFTVLVIIVIFAYAGVQPAATYKNELITNWNKYWTEQTIKNEEKAAKAKIEEQKRIEQQTIAEQHRIAEQKAEEAKLEAILNQNYAQIFNKFRTDNGRQPLIFNTNLNEIAKQRVVEIAQPGNFSHDGIKKYNLGENIAMMAYSTDSNESLLELWATSPGHRSNMLDLTYYQTGFAREGKYAVQVFH